MKGCRTAISARSLCTKCTLGLKNGGWPSSAPTICSTCSRWPAPVGSPTRRIGSESSTRRCRGGSRRWSAPSAAGWWTRRRRAGTLPTTGRNWSRTPTVAPPAEALGTFTSSEVSFQYPRSWIAYDTDGFPIDGEHSDGALVKLSTQDVPFPCTLVTRGDWHVTCEPSRQLPTGGVFVRWRSDRSGSGKPSPSATLDGVPGDPRQIGGFPAKANRQAAAETQCRAVGATEQVSAAILVGLPSGTSMITMTSCLAAPSDTAERQVLDMLDSVAFRG